MNIGSRIAAALVLITLCEPAAAHGMQGAFAPFFWGGLGVGIVAGAWCGWGAYHPGVGLGWAFGSFVAVTVGWAGFAGMWAEGLLASLLIVPIFGGLPLAITFIVMYGVLTVLRERFGKKRADES